MASAKPPFAEQETVNDVPGLLRQQSIRFRPSPGLSAPGGGGGQKGATNPCSGAGYAALRRRIRPRAVRPTPKSARVGGSGAGVGAGGCCGGGGDTTVTRACSVVPMLLRIAPKFSPSGATV